VGQVEHLAPGKLLISVEQNDLVRQSTLSKRVPKRGANGARANDHNLAFSLSMFFSHGYLRKRLGAERELSLAACG
jgi:hypothetical protein